MGKGKIHANFSHPPQTLGFGHLNELFAFQKAQKIHPKCQVFRHLIFGYSKKLVFSPVTTLLCGIFLNCQVFRHLITAYFLAIKFNSRVSSKKKATLYARTPPISCMWQCLVTWITCFINKDLRILLLRRISSKWGGKDVFLLKRFSVEGFAVKP